MRHAGIRHTGRLYLVMCPPEHYEITGDNPRAPPAAKADLAAAMDEWERLRGIYLGYDVKVSEATSEGEGDFLATERSMLAGTGFRTDQSAHFEAQEFFCRPFLGLQLIHEKFYRLDTALCVLDERGCNTIAIDMPQLQMGGGGPKCCTLGLYGEPPEAARSR
ncbi:hypothetical protein [Actinomadura parmotrematis]|uniref:Amidinotransferase n=1 Tax=Actinomadura parmotrematis TaxID=2864039 RepID=A0ABS7FRX6_9ACTN|nr:hypothetical protein [Actinomadura parmotrematis]MBW8483148.1 hypothetical protein [Actinomadura parmotrematis]